ncbi:MAG: hypothetical protein Kow00107_03140 [Planctomycetota bacterium]
MLSAATSDYRPFKDSSHPNKNHRSINYAYASTLLGSPNYRTAEYDPDRWSHYGFRPARWNSNRRHSLRQYHHYH